MTFFSAVVMRVNKCAHYAAPLDGNEFTWAAGCAAFALAEREGEKYGFNQLEKRCSILIPQSITYFAAYASS
jgi:hypothetical protein